MAVSITSPTALDRTRQALASHGVDLLVVAPYADLLYLTGLIHHAGDRPKLLAITADGESILAVPALEAAGLQAPAGSELLVYLEGTLPYAELRERLASVPARPRIAVSDQMWASVLLALQVTYPEAQFIPASPILRDLRML
jgi:Xaa-Pro aminopeptidase